ncbi:hypothetical protein ACFWVF_20705 [Streptomyces sp. NPDC058659]|uniref:hypothetical protein n=1 Tax=unclassified Streptomyces TaxID=2593676 RepID=UPI00364E7D37
MPDETGPDTVYFVEGTAETETWGHGYPAQGADEAAARAWAATAQATAEAAARATAQAVSQAADQAAAQSGAAVAVVGEGALAVLVRMAMATALPAGGVRPDAPPDVVVETTGTAAGITRALRAVRAGGQVLLAARPLAPTTPVDTYRDVHVRDVHLASVPWAGEDARPAPEHLVSWALAHLGSARPDRPDRPAPPGHWHRLTEGPA